MSRKLGSCGIPIYLSIYRFIYLSIYIYIYILLVCVCVCVPVRTNHRTPTRAPFRKTEASFALGLDPMAAFAIGAAMATMLLA